jgi:hypothetical protein
MNKAAKELDTAAALIPSGASLKKLREIAAGCRVCFSDGSSLFNPSCARRVERNAS